MGPVAAGSVLARNPSVLWTSLDGEVVVYVPSSTEVLVLNVTAGVLWECLDGTSPLQDIFADIARAFGVDEAVVEADCLRVLDSWVTAGWALDPAAPPPDPEGPPESLVEARRASPRWGFLADPPNA